MSKENEVKPTQEIKEEIKKDNNLSNIEKKIESDFSNEVRVDLDSKISSLLEHCEQILNLQKIKELLLSGSGKSITKLVTLAEIVKSLHPNLIQNTSFTTISFQVEEGQKVKKDEIDKLSPKLEITLSEQEPQGLIFEKISDEKKEKLIKVWERQKGNKKNNNNNNINNRWGMNQRRNVVNNNKGIFNRWGFVYNNGNRWQGNSFNTNMRNWNWNPRFINRNRNYVNNRRRFNMNY